MKNKGTLITIIVLLVISLPAAIYGTIMHLQNKDVIIDDNPSKEYILNNKVYFYTAEGMLESTYECKNQCTIIEEEINDEKYGINYYKLGEKEVYTNLYNGFALFKEGIDISLYSISSNNVILNYSGVNTYKIDHSNPILILRNGAKYGVVSLNTMTGIIPFQYDFIGIPNRVNNKVLDTSKFIANQGRYWYILEGDGFYNHEPFSSPIVDFNDKYIVTKANSGYTIYDYDKNEYMRILQKKEVYCIGEYTMLITDSNTLLLYNDLNSPALKTVLLNNYTDITFDYHDNTIDIYLDGNNYQSIVL